MVSRQHLDFILNIFLIVPVENSPDSHLYYTCNPHLHSSKTKAFLLFCMMPWQGRPLHSSSVFPPYYSTCPENPLHPRTKTKPHLTHLSQTWQSQIPCLLLFWTGTPSVSCFLALGALDCNAWDSKILVLVLFQTRSVTWNNIPKFSAQDEQFRWMLSACFKLRWVPEFFGALTFLRLLCSTPPSPLHRVEAGSFLTNNAKSSQKSKSQKWRVNGWVDETHLPWETLGWTLCGF